MVVIGQAIEVSDIKLAEENDQDTINYFICLQEHIIETITCIFRAIEDNGHVEVFKDYVKRIVVFINNILKNGSITSNDLRLHSIGLIGDFCHSYGISMKVLLNESLLKQNLDLLTKNINNINEQNNKE